MNNDRRNTLGRYTITSEGASLGYFRLVEDPSGAWCQYAEVEASAIRDVRDDEHPICRLQLPDGTVPGNNVEALIGWKRAYDDLLTSWAEASERIRQAEAL